MESLKKGCLRWAIFYFVLAAITSTLIYIRFPVLQVALGSGAVSAFFLWMGTAYWIGIRTRKAEARMVRRAMTGGRPEDGEKIAVIGTIRSSTETLEAPFSKRRCVAYEYKMIPPDNETAGAWDGFALTPLTIEGTRGSIRLLAVPELEFKDQPLGSREHYDNARDYLARTQFDVRTTINFGREVARMKELLADDDGRVRYDIQRMAGQDPARMILQEKILAPGDKVIAIGRYSAARGGLVPDKTAVLHPVKILKDDPEEFIRKLGRGDFGYALMGCGCLLPVLVAAFIALATMPLDVIEANLPEKDPSWTEVRLERWVRKTAAKLPFLPSPEETTISIPLDEARGKVTADGKTTPLRTAEAKKDGDVFEIRLTGDGAPEPGVVLRIRTDFTIESLRVIGDGTIAASDVELTEFRAADDRVIGRFTALSASRGGPHVRAVFHASVASSADGE